MRTAADVRTRFSWVLIGEISGPDMWGNRRSARRLRERDEDRGRVGLHVLASVPSAPLRPAGWPGLLGEYEPPSTRVNPPQVLLHIGRQPTVSMAVWGCRHRPCCSMSSDRRRAGRGVSASGLAASLGIPTVLSIWGSLRIGRDRHAAGRRPHGRGRSVGRGETGPHAFFAVGTSRTRPGFGAPQSPRSCRFAVRNLTYR